MTVRWLALILLGLCAGAVHAAGDECMDGATTELEQMYCRVVSEGLGGGLPSPTDFKRNDPQVQALLLRRPAGRLGLPEPGAPAQADPSPEPSGAEPEPARTGPEEDPPQSWLLSEIGRGHV